jgi:ABC-type uncharacterized transport system involved in gliding motility auxiliary subunit
VGGLRYKELAKSSEYSYLDNSGFSVNPLQERWRAPDAKSGPFSLAMLVEGTLGVPASEGAKEGRIILFSSSRFIRSEFPVKPVNFGVFLNMIDWSLQDEVLLQIRSKGFQQRPIKKLSDPTRLLIKFIMIFFLPFLSLVMGFIIYRNQKIRRAMMPLKYQQG